MHINFGELSEVLQNQKKNEKLLEHMEFATTPIVKTMYGRAGLQRNYYKIDFKTLPSTFNPTVYPWGETYKCHPHQNPIQESSNKKLQNNLA